MKTLRRMLVRDVHRQFGQFVAIVVLILLGTALLVASYDAYRNLDRSYRSLFDVAVDHRAAVNRVEVLSGERFSSASEGVLVEQQLANHFGVTRGDELAIRGPLGWRDVEVTGVAASAEYLWPARSRQEVFTTPDSFGVLFAPQPLVAQLTGGPNEVLVRVTGHDRAAVVDRVDGPRRRPAQRPSPPAPSSRATQCCRTTSRFPGADAVLPAAVPRRRGHGDRRAAAPQGDTERPIIGTLRANGFTRRQVLMHYLGYGVAGGTLGAALGVPLGLVGARELTSTYTSVLNLPATVIDVHAESIVGGVAFGVVTGAVAAWLPARTAARVAPAEAMRGLVPQAGRTGMITRLLPVIDRLPATWRMILRNPERHPGRTVATLVGVVL